MEKCFHGNISIGEAVAVLFCRPHSVSDDVSSELQRIAAVDGKDMNSPNPFCRRGGLSRYGSLGIVSLGKGNLDDY